ncbi:MAG: MOSC N-terminal beta barrel domain-containing protein, partial [Aeromonas sp.]
MPTLSSISLYPIKSTAGMTQARAHVTQEGLAWDRRYMITKP